jgi:anti-sigma factor RsiW
MTCKELCDLLMAYCEGELSAQEREEICAHLSRCSPCVNYVETYRITVSITRKLPGSELPEGLVEKIRAALEQDKKEF